MASVCRDVVLLVMAVLGTAAHAQDTARPSIANPDFPCGVPWGPLGERPEEPHRVERQIILPDHKEYKNYLAILESKKKVPDSVGLEGEGEDPFTEINIEDIYCITTVISDRFLITAAHCLANEEFPVSSVRLGDIDPTSDNEEYSKPVNHDIQNIIIHPKYDPTDLVRYNDIALLQTYDKIQFNDVVFPYCVSSGIPAPDTSLKSADFGYFNATPLPDDILEVEFKVMDTAECEDLYRENDFEPILRLKYPNLLQNTDTFCVTNNVTDACQFQGHSGGPLYRDVDGRRYIEGIFVVGLPCQSNYTSVLPGLYASIANHIDFINHYVFNPPSDPPTL